MEGNKQMKKYFVLFLILLSTVIYSAIYLYEKNTRRVLLNVSDVQVYKENEYTVYKSSDYMIVVKTDNFDVMFSTMEITNGKLLQTTTEYFFINTNGIIYKSTYTIIQSTGTLKWKTGFFKE